MDYKAREVYQSAPLALVTTEIRFNYEPALNGREARDAFALAVRDSFPIWEQSQAVSLTVQGPGVPVSQEIVPQLRAYTKERDAFLQLSANGLSTFLAGSAYRHFEQFAELIDCGVRALLAAVPEPSFRRVGLRYLDEIRPTAGVERTADWGNWVNSAMIGAAGALEPELADSVNGATRFNFGEGRGLLLQWGEVQEGSVLLQEFPTLAGMESTLGKFFVLDIDSYWEPQGFNIVEQEVIAEAFAQLHQPVGRIFQWSITDASREMFRR